MKTFGQLPEIQTLENNAVLAANNAADTVSNKITFANLKSQILSDIPSPSTVPTKTSDLTNDSGFITASDIPTIPSKVSDLTNDTGFITSGDIPDSTSDLVNDSGFITANDIPTVPTKVSDLINDSSFITNVVNDLVNYYLKSETYSKTEVDTLVTTIKNSRFEVVNSLPTEDIKTNVIYLVPSTNSTTGNIKDEYINLNGTTNGWEKIGSTNIDLSNYITSTDLNTALASKADTSSIPTKTSDLTNDSNFVSDANYQHITVDSAFSDTSTNPLQNKVVNSLKETLTQQINNNGSKNLLPNIFRTGSEGSSTHKGVTFTMDEDGIISVSGTATGGIAFAYVGGLNGFSLPLGTYKVTGISGGSSSSYQINLYKNGSNVGNYNNEFEFIVENASDTYFIRIRIAENYTANNLQFPLMLRLASDPDDTYEPYAKTNQQLTQETTGLIDNQNVNGAVNMCPNDLQTQVDSSSGLTLTVNDDKTVRVSATSGSYPFTVSASLAIDICSSFYVGAGNSIKITGCPSGGSSETYRLRLIAANAYTQKAEEYGRGRVFNATDDNYGLRLIISSGTVLTAPLIFKPMISLASMNLSYDDYVPYVKSNKELTDDIKELTEDIASITKYKEQFYSFYQDWNWTSGVDNYATSLGIEHSNTLRQLYEKLSSNQQPAPRIVITVNSGSYTNTNNSAQFLRDICDIFGITGLAIGYFEIQGILKSEGRMIIKVVPSGLGYVKYAYLNNWELSGSVKQITLS